MSEAQGILGLHGAPKIDWIDYEESDSLPNRRWYNEDGSYSHSTPANTDRSGRRIRPPGEGEGSEDIISPPSGINRTFDNPTGNPIDFDKRRPFPEFDPWAPGRRITYPYLPWWLFIDKKGNPREYDPDNPPEPWDQDEYEGPLPPSSDDNSSENGNTNPPPNGDDMSGDDMSGDFFNSYLEAEQVVNARDDLNDEEKTGILGILERIFNSGQRVSRFLIDIILNGIRLRKKKKDDNSSEQQPPPSGEPPPGGEQQPPPGGETRPPTVPVGRNGKCPEGYKKETIDAGQGGPVEFCVLVDGIGGPPSDGGSGNKNEGTPKPDASGNCPPGFRGVDTNGDGINDVCVPEGMGILDLLRRGLGMAGSGSRSRNQSDLTTAAGKAGLQVFNDPVNFMRFAPSPLQMIDPRYYNITSFVPAGEQRDFNMVAQRLPGQLYANRAPETVAQGGLMQLAAGGFPRKNGQIAGPGTETSDDIPAMLSDGEFVVNAKAVRGIGDLMGQKRPKNALDARRQGAKAMYALQRAGEQAAGLRR